MKRALMILALGAGVGFGAACQRDTSLELQQGPAGRDYNEPEQRTPEEANRSQKGMGGSFGAGAETGGEFDSSDGPKGGIIEQGREDPDPLTESP